MKIFKGSRIDLLVRAHKGLKSAEVGVHEGDFSSNVFQYASPSLHTMIDPWCAQPSDVFRGQISFGDQDDFDNRHDRVCRRFALQHQHGVGRIYRDLSEKMLSGMPTNFLDWIYIDGNHSYATTMSDLLMARRVVKPDGFIAGHDYVITGVNKTIAVVEAITDYLDRFEDSTLLLKTPDLYATFVIVRKSEVARYDQLFFGEETNGASGSNPLDEQGP